MRRIIYLVFLILSASLAQGAVTVKAGAAKAKPHKPLIAKVDSASDVSLRSIDSATIKRYREQRDFKYDAPPPTESWWDRFLEWLGNKIDRMFVFKGASILGIIVNIIMILVLVAAFVGLVYAILTAVGIDPLSLLRRNSAPAPVPYSEFFEDINTIDFDTEIENAVAKHNYRFAVRLLYLKCLKQLSDAGLIKWEIDKTNTQYIFELQNNDQRSAFSSLTRQFEYVWYGEFMIDNQVYGIIANSFRDFNGNKA